MGALARFEPEASRAAHIKLSRRSFRKRSNITFPRFIVDAESLRNLDCDIAVAPFERITDSVPPSEEP